MAAVTLGGVLPPARHHVQRDMCALQLSISEPTQAVGPADKTLLSSSAATWRDTAPDAVHSCGVTWRSGFTLCNLKTLLLTCLGSHCCVSKFLLLI